MKKTSKPSCEVLFVSAVADVRDAVRVIDKGRVGIALVVDADRHLIGTITDGDVRRVLLEGKGLDVSVADVLKTKATSLYPKPLTARVGMDQIELRRMMVEAKILQLPILDEQDRVVDLVTLNELVGNDILPLQAVVMAGGKGQRLHPLTEHTPKPMLPVGDRPLMEHIIGQLRDAGVRRVNVTTHYLADMIRDHFGDGAAHGVEIQYTEEDRALETAGALSLMESPDQPFLVINGDILTDVDFRALLAFHKEHEADLTVCVRQYDVKVPYGVVQTDGVRVLSIEEKPEYAFLVNAGIYLLEPELQASIPPDEVYDMTDLVERLIKEDRRVVSFPIHEYWLDIGKPEDYERAQAEHKQRRSTT